MSGSGRTILETNATANIPATVTLAARTLENRGTVVVYNSGKLNVISGAVFTNCAGALFHVVNENPSLGGGQQMDDLTMPARSSSPPALEP